MKELKLNELKSTAKLISVTFLGFVVERKYKILHLNVEWVLCWIWNWKKKNRQIDDGTREKQYFNKFQSIFFSKKKQQPKSYLKIKVFGKSR